jgi:hypothetical protein
MFTRQKVKGDIPLAGKISDAHSSMKKKKRTKTKT